MPLSSVVGAQSIVKPGVCTSSTRPASPYDGQVIYETDTDKTLVYNGSGWVQLSTGTANFPGLELVKTQTIGSAVSSVTVSDVFSSTYDNYLMVLSGGAGSTAQNLNLTLGSTSSGYYWSAILRQYTTSTVTADQGANGSIFAYAGRGTTGSLSSQITFLNPFLSKNTHVIYQNSGAATADYYTNGAGYLADTTSYTAFTLTTNTGTMTGGTVRVYGYRN